MKNLSKVFAISCLCVSLCACQSMHGFNSQSKNGITFDYSLDNARANNISQVFSLNGKTIIQFKQLPDVLPTLTNATGQRKSYHIIGQNIVLDDDGSYLKLTSDRGTTHIRLKNNFQMHSRQLKFSSHDDTQEDVLTDETDLSDEYLQTQDLTQNDHDSELSDLKEQIKLLSQQIKQMTSSNTSQQSLLLKQGVFYTFDHERYSFKPNSDLKRKLTRLLDGSDRVIVRCMWKTKLLDQRLNELRYESIKANLSDLSGTQTPIIVFEKDNTLAEDRFVLEFYVQGNL